MGNLLIIIGHPRGESLSAALARAYREGAEAAGWTVRAVSVADLRFDPDLQTTSPRLQPLEPDLEDLRRAIEGADHLLLVHPTWWGGPPARMKAVFDRIFQAGWAFEEIHGGTGFRGLLGGRTAEIITTMDTPPLAYRLLVRAPGVNQLDRAILRFCGMDVVRRTLLGPVNTSDAAARSGWIDRARGLGRSLAGGPRSPMQRILRRAGPWLAGLRLQFYPMTLIAYWVGALAAPGRIDMAVFLTGLCAIFALEAATVFSNDIHDRESDMRNEFWGPFTGGSRVLVEGRLSPDGLRRGFLVALSAAVLLFAAAVAMAPAPVAAAAVALPLWVLALGYTIPPLKLSWRGLGEVTVALTHSFGVLVLGAVLQGAGPFDPLPWAIALPLCVAVVPAILLAGIPDRDADRQAGKRTQAVRLGIPAVLWLAAALAVAAAVLAVLVRVPALAGLAWIALPHALWFGWSCLREAERGVAARRIDGLMVNGLVFILWFGVIPLFNLLRTTA